MSKPASRYIRPIKCHASVRCDLCDGPTVPERCEFLICDHILCSACADKHDMLCQWKRPQEAHPPEGGGTQ